MRLAGGIADHRKVDPVAARESRIIWNIKRAISQPHFQYVVLGLHDEALGVVEDDSELGEDATSHNRFITQRGDDDKRKLGRSQPDAAHVVGGVMVEPSARRQRWWPSGGPPFVTISGGSAISPSKPVSRSSPPLSQGWAYYPVGFCAPWGLIPAPSHLALRTDGAMCSSSSARTGTTYPAISWPQARRRA